MEHGAYAHACVTYLIHVAAVGCHHKVKGRPSKSSCSVQIALRPPLELFHLAAALPWLRPAGNTNTAAAVIADLGKCDAPKVVSKHSIGVTFP